MKLTSYIYLILIIGLYISNYYLFKINWFTFTGIVLTVLILSSIIINFAVKYRKKKKGIVDNDFIFPESMAKPMKTLDIGIQYEASIISIAFLMVGILFFAIYVFFFAPYTWIMKGFVVFNSLCGLVLMGSMLITNYQQLITYRESTKMFDSFKDKLGTEVVSPDKINETPKTETETTIEILDNERRL